MNKFFIFIKNFIFSALLIYLFDLFIISFGISIPINFFTIFLVSLFGTFGLICLVLFGFVMG